MSLPAEKCFTLATQLTTVSWSDSGFCHLSDKGCDALVEMTEGLCTTEVIEIQRLDATQCLVVAFSTDRTEDMAVIICQQLIEDMDAEIACSCLQRDR